jgi:hypothetical protein
MPSSALWRRCAVRKQGSSRHLLPDTKKELVDMRISWEECDPKSGVITQVLGRSYRDHEETRTHVRRELSEYMERFI